MKKIVTNMNGLVNKSHQDISGSAAAACTGNSDGCDASTLNRITLTKRQH